MSFEAYKIAVKLSLVNNVSTGLVALATQFQALNSHINGANASMSQLERKMLGIKRMGLIGGAMAGAGAFGLSLFAAPLEEAKKFQTEEAKFASLGFGDKVTNQAVQFANGMKTIGTSATENLALVSDAMAVFKDLHHAEFAAPIMAKMKFANEAVFGKEGGGANERKFMDMLKVIEFRGGLSSQQEFGTQADYVQKVIAGSRNRVDAGQLLAALKTGGVALSQRSNESFYLGSEPLIQEFGGQRYGTGAMSIYQNLVQSRGTITAQQELDRLGLLDRSKIEFNSLGKLKKALPGAFKGSEILEKQGELALLNQVLLPAFAAKGITSDEDVVRELGMIIGNRTGSGLMARIFQQRNTIAMQSEANKSAMGIDQLSGAANKTLAGKELDLHAKWRDVLKELGTTVLPIAIKAVEGLTDVLKGVIAFAREFPLLTKGLTIAFGVLAGLVAVGGTIMLAKSAFMALGLAMPTAGIRGLAMSLGKAGLAGAAIVGVYEIGKLAFALKDLWDATHREGVTLSKYSQDRIANMSPQEKARFDAMDGDFKPLQPLPSGGMRATGSSASPYIAGRTTAGQTINNTIVMPDGRVLAKVVTEQWGNESRRPSAAGTRFDGSMSPVSPGMTGAH